MGIGDKSEVLSPVYDGGGFMSFTPQLPASGTGDADECRMKAETSRLNEST